VLYLDGSTAQRLPHASVRRSHSFDEETQAWTPLLPLASRAAGRGRGRRSPSPAVRRSARERTAPAPPPPAARRSGRERKATTVQIGGYAVLRANAEGLAGDGAPAAETSEEAEEAAWEAQSQSDSGFESEDSAPRRAAKRRRSPAPARGAPAARSAARLAEVAARRAAFFGRHLSVLLPFLEPRVASRLRAQRDAAAAAAAEAAEAAEGDADAPAAPAAHVAVPPLPAQVVATLQPHQVTGYEYLVSRRGRRPALARAPQPRRSPSYEAGLSPILGDEMGLGKTLQAITLLAHGARPGAALRPPHAPQPRTAASAGRTWWSARSPSSPPGRRSWRAGAPRCACCAATRATRASGVGAATSCGTRMSTMWRSQPTRC